MMTNRISCQAGPILIIIALHIGCALLVDPRGEFPLNDDWSYTRTAFQFGQTGKMQVDEWSAPTLVGQAFYGGILVRLAGRSFITLRLSSLVLACALACILWALMRRLGLRDGQAWMLVLAWMFNPVGFCLSYSYMTEIPFLFFVGTGLWFGMLYLDGQKPWQIISCGIFLGYAFCIRQTSILFLAPLVLALFFALKSPNIQARISRSLWLAASAGVLILGYKLWSVQLGGTTPAAQRKFELLKSMTSTQIIGNLVGLLFYLSFFLLPVCIYLLPALIRMCRSKPGMACFWGTVWGSFSAWGLWWFDSRFSRVPYLPGRAYHSRMPYLLNVLYDTGLGPFTLDPTYYGRTPTPNYPLFWLIVTCLTALGVVALGIYISLALPPMLRNKSRPARRTMVFAAVVILVTVALFEIVFSHVQEGGLFDRHILTAELPLLLLIAGAGAEASDLYRAGQAEPRERVVGYPALRKLCFALAAAVLVCYAIFCVAGTHDYLAWNRARWDLGRELLATGVDPLTISGGFEFNGWHNYDTFRKRGNISRIYYWWYDRPEYVIAMEPQEEYSILRHKEYYSWLHRKSYPVYVLKKAA